MINDSRGDINLTVGSVFFTLQLVYLRGCMQVNENLYEKLELTVELTVECVIQPFRQSNSAEIPYRG